MEKHQRSDGWLTDRLLDREDGIRLSRIPTKLNEFGYDPFGFNPDTLRYILPVAAFLFRRYFRAEVHGIERFPEGRVLVVSNHAGQLPFDGLVLGTAALLEAEPPRILRSMVERWVPHLPLVSTFMSRAGQVLGTPDNCVRLLQNGEAILIFPEGVRGIAKIFRDRYQLQPFGSGFMRLALETDTPILPVAVIGSEEQIPSLVNLKALGRLLGMPALPLTPTLLPLPLPVKYRIYFGDPLTFSGNADDEDAVLSPKVEAVRRAIQTLIHQGLKERKHIFW